MNIKLIKKVSIGSIVLLGILILLNIWEVINLEEFGTKLMFSLGVIFVVSTLIHQIEIKKH